MTQGPREGMRASREGCPGPGQHPSAYSAGNFGCGGGERREVRRGGKPAKRLRPSLVQCDGIWTRLQPQSLFLNKGHSRALGARAGLRDMIHPVWELGPKAGASICPPHAGVQERPADDRAPGGSRGQDPWNLPVPFTSQDWGRREWHRGSKGALARHWSWGETASSVSQRT